jgi:hypothetical protein
MDLFYAARASLAAKKRKSEAVKKNLKLKKL